MNNQLERKNKWCKNVLYLMQLSSYKMSWAHALKVLICWNNKIKMNPYIFALGITERKLSAI